MAVLHWKIGAVGAYLDSANWIEGVAPGAGDTAIAVFTLGLLAGADPREAADLANRASGIAVGKLGTATVTPAELEASFR